MPFATANDVRLSYTLTGEAGPPLVLVHGSWTDRSDWDLVRRAFAEHFRVLTYDRRGHSQSEHPIGQGSIEEDVADLAGLMEQLDLAPAHVVGLSFGGSIALRLAARRPDLFHSLSVHEPPLLGLLAGDPVHRSTTQAVFDRITAAAARLAAGDAEGGARQFVETVALGPGAWDQVPPTVRQTFVRNAATFLDETRDPKAFTLDLTELAAFPRPALLTRGDRSPAWFAPIVARLAAVLPRAETRVFAGAGHPIVLTHPAAYAAAITDHAQAADEMARAEPLRLAR